jgi:hypothetical protein
MIGEQHEERAAVLVTVKFVKFRGAGGLAKGHIFRRAHGISQREAGCGSLKRT